MSTNIEIIDTHAHLYSEELKINIDSILERATGENVSHIIMPNIDKDSIQDMLDLSERYPQCHPAMGLHPCYVKDDFKMQLKIVEEKLAKGIYIAVGEVGMDLYWDKSTLDIQKLAFDLQIKWSGEYGLPLLIHSREAQGLTIEMVKAQQKGQLTGIFHCFGGTNEEAQAAIDLGFYLGIGGVVTYKNSGLADVLKSVPLEYIVLETDSPYLSPVPHRGKVNEPSYLKHILGKLSEIYEVSTEEVSKLTTITAKKIFKTIHQK